MWTQLNHMRAKRTKLQKNWSDWVKLRVNHNEMKISQYLTCSRPLSARLQLEELNKRRDLTEAETFLRFSGPHCCVSWILKMFKIVTELFSPNACRVVVGVLIHSLFTSCDSTSALLFTANLMVFDCFVWLLYLVKRAFRGNTTCPVCVFKQKPLFYKLNAWFKNKLFLISYFF